MQTVKTLFQPIVSESPGVPLVLNVVVTRREGEMEGGPSQSVRKAESYVCLSQLPPELQERVRTAVQMLLQV